MFVNAYCARCGTEYQAMKQFIAQRKSQCPSCCGKDIHELQVGALAPAISRLQPASQPKSKPAAQPAKTKPVKQIQQPVEPKTGKAMKYQVFGKYGGCEVLRWMGKQGFNLEQAKKALEIVSSPLPSEVTIKAALQQGRAGKRGAPAPLTTEEAQQLLAAK